MDTNNLPTMEKLDKAINQFSNPEKFKNNEVSGFATLLSTIRISALHNPEFLAYVLENGTFMAKFEEDWNKLFEKFCNDNFRSQNNGLHLDAAILLVKELSIADLRLAAVSTNWQSIIFKHLGKIPFKRHYLKDYLYLARHFVCLRYASRSSDIKGDQALIESTHKCLKNDTIRVALYAALNLYSFSAELQFSPEFRENYADVHNLGAEIFEKISENLQKGMLLDSRETIWIEELGRYLNDISLYPQKQHLIRQIGRDWEY